MMATSEPTIQPKVSVIIPTYNCERFVSEAIISVLNQTYEDFEVIVVDDGSTDNTKMALSPFRGKIRYFYQENNGVSSARNHGIVVSRGEYVLFLDADDLLLPNSLMELSTFLDTHSDVGLVYSDGYFCDASGQEIMRLSEHQPSNFSGNALQYMILGNFIVAPHCAMVRRCCLESLDPPGFDEKLSFSADRDLWTRLAQICAFGYKPVCTCKYRVHGNNMSSRRSGQREDYKAYQYKVLKSPYFSKLPPITQCTFLQRMLLNTLRGQRESQEALLQSPEVQALSSSEQAYLSYFLGTQFILDKDGVTGRSYVRRAIELAPSSLKYRVVWLLAAVNASFARVVLLVRRWLSGIRIHRAVKASPFEAYLSWSSTLPEDQAAERCTREQTG